MPNPHPKPALSLTHDLLCVLSMDTWWNFGYEFKKKQRKADTLLQIKHSMIWYKLLETAGCAQTTRSWWHNYVMRR